MRVITSEELIKRNSSSFGCDVIAGDIYARLDRRVPCIHAVHLMVYGTDRARVHPDQPVSQILSDGDYSGKAVSCDIREGRCFPIADNPLIREDLDNTCLHIDDLSECDFHGFFESEPLHLELNIINDHGPSPKFHFALSS